MISNVEEYEIDRLAEMISAFNEGRLSEAELKPLRTIYGIHRLRNTDTVMLRIKTPGGHLSGAQLRVIATIAKKNCPHPEVHLTTRQCIQLYNLELSTVPIIIRELMFFGLSTRTAGGKSVRNITANWDTGLAMTEEFDVLPYLRSLQKNLLKIEKFKDLPAKIKIAFNSKKGMDLRTDSNDIAIYAVNRIQNGIAEHGFQVKVGGGLGKEPRLAKTIYEFIGHRHLHACVRGILTWFISQSKAANSSKRLKFIVENLTAGEIRKETARLTDSRADAPPIITSKWEYGEPPVNTEGETSVEYQKWFTHASPQIQKNRYAAVVESLLGQISCERLEKIANVADQYGGGFVRIDFNQNMWIPHIWQSALPGAWRDLGRPHPLSNLQLVSCPGPKHCRTGQIQSRALALELDKSKPKFPAAFKDTIRVSACRNGCSQHLVSQLGWAGEVVMIDGKASPQFALYGGDGKTAHATRLVTLPARKVAGAVELLLDWWAQCHKEGENAGTFLSRNGTAVIERFLESHLKKDPDSLDIYMDNGPDKLFIPAQVEPADCS